MTGRELIVYILQNGLEDEVVFGDGFMEGFMSETEAAAKFGVGVWTIKAWCMLGSLNGIKIGDDFYFPKNTTDPRKRSDVHEC